MKIKIFILLIILQIITFNLFADDDEYFPEDGFFDRVNRIRNVDNASIFNLFHSGLYLEWRQQATVYSINRLDDVVEISRMYVYNFCKWNINEMYILRKRFDNVNLVWVAFIWVNSKDPHDWHVQLYAIEN
jgi:hypothetical protein